MRWYYFLLLTAIAYSCGSKTTQEIEKLPEAGVYQGTLDIQGNPLIFRFEIKHKPLTFILDNIDESFKIEDFTLTEDSLVVPLHIFDTQLKAAYKQGRFEGHWIKNYADGYEIAFSAQKEEVLSAGSEGTMATPSTLASKYRVYFESEIEDSTVAVAEFEQNGNMIKGTFLTETGDYRFLNGTIKGNQLKLSTFDGEHAFVFAGEVDDAGMIHGHFASGKTWHEQWWAHPDMEVQLADASTITYLKNGAKTLHFEGKALDGTSENLDDDMLNGKPFILQIMGTWCPNCMDETKFLSQWHTLNPDIGVELVSLAFERKDNYQYAKERLTLLRDRFNVGYPLLFGGGYDKELATKKLPELSAVVAYPTLVFYNSNHEVTHIHTGFTGPGTGVHFERWKLDFEKRVAEIAP